MTTRMARTCLLITLWMALPVTADEVHQMFPVPRVGDSWSYEVLRQVKGRRKPVLVARMLVTIGAREMVSLEGRQNNAWRFDRTYYQAGQKPEKTQFWMRLVPAELKIFTAVGFGPKVVRQVARVDLEAEPVVDTRKRFAFAMTEALLEPVIATSLGRSLEHYEAVTESRTTISVPAGRFKGASLFSYKPKEGEARAPRWTQDVLAFSAKAGVVEYRGSQARGGAAVEVMAPTWVRLKRFKRPRLKK